MAQWYDITRSPKYQELNDSEKLQMKQLFFKEHVIPKLDEDESLKGRQEVYDAAFRNFMQTPDDTGQGYVTSMLGSVGRGFGEMVPGAIEGVGALTGIEPVREAGQSVREGLEYISPVNPKYAESIPVRLAGVGGQVGSVLATAGAGGLAGKALAGAGAVGKGAQTAALGSAFLQGAAEGKREAERYGMEGPEAYLRTLAGGVTEAGTELLPFGLASETALAKRLLAGAPKTTGFLGTALSEGGEGTLGQIGSNIATKALAPIGAETPGITEGALEAGAYGAFGGGILGGVNALIPNAPKKPSPSVAAVSSLNDAAKAAAPDDTAQSTAVVDTMQAQMEGLEGAQELPEFEPITPNEPVVQPAVGKPVRAEVAPEEPAITEGEAPVDLTGVSEAPQFEEIRQAPQEGVAGEPEDVTPPQAASMPMMVTRDMKQQLVDLGYSKSDINAMRPAEAAAVIKAGVSKEKPSVQPEATNAQVIEFQPDQLDSFQVDPIDLERAQADITPENAAQVDLSQPALGIQTPNGAIQIVDGAHRLVAAKLSGRPLNVSVFPAQIATPAVAQPQGQQALFPQQPTTTQENAPPEIPLEESLRQEPQDRVEVRTPEETGVGDSLLSPTEGEKEVAAPSEIAASSPSPVETEEQRFTRIKAMKPSQRSDEDVAFANAFSRRQKEAGSQVGETTRKDFLKDYSASTHGRIRKALDQGMNFRGLQGTVGAWVETLFNEGWRMAIDARGNRQFTDGKAALGSSGLGKVGMNYADFLSSKKTQSPPTTGEVPTEPLPAEPRVTPGGVATPQTWELQQMGATSGEWRTIKTLRSQDEVDAKFKSLPKGATGWRIIPSQTNAAETQTPAPSRQGAGAAGASSSLEGGRSSELPKPSLKTEKESSSEIQETTPQKAERIIGELDLAARGSRTMAYSTAEEREVPVLTRGASVADIEAALIKATAGNDELLNEIAGQVLPNPDKVAKGKLIPAIAAQIHADASTQRNALLETYAEQINGRELKTGDKVSWYDDKDRQLFGVIKRIQNGLASIARGEEAQEKGVLTVPVGELKLDDRDAVASRRKSLDSIVGGSTNAVLGQVTPADGVDGLSYVINRNEVPGVLNAFVGTSKDFLANPENERLYPALWKAVKSGVIDEGNFYNGRAFVFTDGIGVNDSDRSNARRLGIPASVAAVRRVLLHESLVHRGIFGLPANLRNEVLGWVRSESTPEDFDILAKDYPRYTDWRNSPEQFAALAEEWLAKKVEKLTRVPTTGPMARLMDILTRIWRWITGNEGDPTIQNLRDVLKLLKAGAEAAEQRLADGSAVKMSGFVPNAVINTLPSSNEYIAKTTIPIVAGINPADAYRRYAKDYFDWRAKGANLYDWVSTVDVGDVGGRMEAESVPLQTSIGPDNRITINLGNPLPSGFTGDETVAKKRIADAIDEEIIHAADLVALRSKWESNGSQGALNEFILAQTQREVDDVLLAYEGMSAKDQEAIESTIQASFALYQGKRIGMKLPQFIEALRANGRHDIEMGMMAELVRQVIQLHQTGGITETGWRSIAKPLVEWMRKMLDALQIGASKIKNGGFGDLLKKRVSEAESILAQLLSSGSTKNSRISYSSPLDAQLASAAARVRTMRDNLAPADFAPQKEPSPGGLDEATGLPLNADGTVTLYHGTTKDRGAEIKRTSLLRSAGEPDVYLTTASSGTGYGDGTVVAVRVMPEQLELDDEFPDGRRDFRLPVGKGKSVRVQIETLPESSRAAGGTSPQAIRTAIRSAYDRALVGESSVQVTLEKVFNEAKKEIPTLTEKQFGEQVQNLYNDNAAVLIPADRSSDMLAAGEKWGVFDAMGLPATFVAVIPETSIDEMLSGTNSSAPSFEANEKRSIPTTNLGAFESTGEEGAGKQDAESRRKLASVVQSVLSGTFVSPSAARGVGLSSDQGGTFIPWPDTVSKPATSNGGASYGRMPVARLKELLRTLQAGVEISRDSRSPLSNVSRQDGTQVIRVNPDALASLMLAQESQENGWKLFANALLEVAQNANTELPDIRSSKISGTTRYAESNKDLRATIQAIVNAGDLVDSQARALKDYPAEQHIKQGIEPKVAVAIQAIDDLLASGVPVGDLPAIINSQSYLESLGIENNLDMQQYIAIEALKRVSLEALKVKNRKSKNGLAKSGQKNAEFWHKLGEINGRSLGTRGHLIKHPRYMDMFTELNILATIADQQEKATEQAVENPDKLAADIQKAGEKATDEAAQDVEEDFMDRMLRAGLDLLPANLKQLFEEISDLIADIGILDKIDSDAKSSISAASKRALERQAQFIAMGKEKRANLRQSMPKLLEEKLNKLADALAGKDATTEQKEDTKKRIRKSAEKKASESGKKKAETPESSAKKEQARKAKADATAQRLIYRTEELFRQGFKNDIRSGQDKPSIYKEFQQQITNPTDLENFAARLAKLKVSRGVAERMFRTAALEKADREKVKFLREGKRLEEIREKQAMQLVYLTEQNLRQSGVKGIQDRTDSENDSVRKAFREQIHAGEEDAALKQPLSIEEFKKRLADLHVRPEVAEIMFKTAERERADIKAMKRYDLLESPDALERMVRKLSSLRPNTVSPLMEMMRWRDIFGESVGTQQDRLDAMQKAIENDESFSYLSNEDKADLISLIQEAWDAKRNEILQSEIKRLTRVYKMKDKAQEAIEGKIPEILQMVNRGVFDVDELRKIVAEKYGFADLTPEQRTRLHEISARLQENIPAHERARLGQELKQLLTDVTKIPFAEIVSTWWVTSILSGFRTAFTIGFGFLSGGFEVIGNALTTISINPTDPNAWTSALESVKRWGASMGAEFNRAWQILFTGDVGLLDPSLSKSAAFLNEGAGKAAGVDVSYKLKKHKNPLVRAAGQWLSFMQNLLLALDSFNANNTKYAMLPLAYYYHRKNLFNPKELESFKDLKAAEDVVIRRDFDGKRPTDALGKARLNAWARNELYEAIGKLQGTVEDMNYAAQQGAMTLDPTGVGGIFYHKVLGLQATLQREAQKYLDDAKRGRLNGEIDPLVARGKEALGYVYQMAAHNFLGALGLKFARFAGNRFNQTLSFLPVLGALRFIEEAPAGDIHKLTIARNQAIGILIAGIGYSMLKAMADEPDDEKRGWGIEGSWANLTPQQKSQRLAEGSREYTIFYNGKSYNYQNWPIGGILAAIGSLGDLIRYSPDKWKEKSVANRLASAAWAAAASVGDSAALSQMAEILGTSMSSRDPIEASMNKMSRVVGNYAGGFVPRFIKDIDLMANPKINTYKTLWERLSKEIPVYRRYEGKALYDIFHKQVAPSRMPWSREIVEQPPELEYKLLGNLNQRGVWLTPANPENRMVGKGRARRSMTQAEADRYTELVGSEYRNFILRYGPRMLQMPTERAKAFMADKTEELRDRALKRIVRSS